VWPDPTAESQEDELPAEPPRFNVELEGLLPAINDAFPATLTPDMILSMRKVAGGPPLEELAATDGFDIHERAVPGPEGAPDVTLLIARPTEFNGKLPVLYHMHGGGFFMGDRRFAVPNILPWARELGALVVSVEYRLAPENPYPAGIEDAYAGLAWVVSNAEDLGADIESIVLVGLSAGGGMAAGLSYMLRDRGALRPRGQLLMAPMLDDLDDQPSKAQMEGIGIWDRTSNQTGWNALLGTTSATEVASYAAPARATDLSKMPPTYLDVGTAESLRDEVIDYAQRIAQAGGDVELHVWPGAFHASDIFVPTARISKDAADARVRWLRRLLSADLG
jgi:acetyl esterase/lipase